MTRFTVLFVCFVFVFHHVESEIIAIKDCAGEYESSNCKIDEVRISPCPDATKSKPCKAKKGESLNMEVDFTPSFNSSSLLATLSWDSGPVKIPLPGMNNDGCKYISCPLRKDKKQKFKYDLTMKKWFPRGKYSVLFLMKNENNASDVCCFVFEVNVLGHWKF